MGLTAFLQGKGGALNVLFAEVSGRDLRREKERGAVSIKKS